MEVIHRVLMIVVLLFGILPLTYEMPEITIASEANYDNSLYMKVKQNVAHYNSDFVIHYTGNTKALDKQLQLIMQNIKENDPYIYENISKWNASYSYKGNKAKIVFNIDYLTNYEQEQFVNQEIKRLTSEIMKPGMKDIEKIKAIHDYLIVNTEYSAETMASRYTTYAVLTENKAVCQGYAFFMYRMLKESSFDTKYVKGYAGGELHGWVLVKLHDDWYHIDATWNDPMPNRDNQVRYKYFLVSDKKMALSHTWDKTFYPSANSEKYSAYHVADNAYTLDNQVYYRNTIDNRFYVMNMNTLRSIIVSDAYYNRQVNIMNLFN